LDFFGLFRGLQRVQIVFPFSAVTNSDMRQRPGSFAGLVVSVAVGLVHVIAVVPRHSDVEQEIVAKVWTIEPTSLRFMSQGIGVEKSYSRARRGNSVLGQSPWD
jgi:hypothetical protein